MRGRRRGELGCAASLDASDAAIEAEEKRTSWSRSEGLGKPGGFRLVDSCGHAPPGKARWPGN